MGAKQSAEMKRAIKLVQEKGLRRVIAAARTGVHVSSLNKALALLEKANGNKK